MRGLGRRLAVQTLSQLLTFGLCASSTESFTYQRPQQRPTPAASDKTVPADNCCTLHCYLRKAYLDPFELSPHLEFSASEIAAEKHALEEGRTSCASEFRARAKQYHDKIAREQKQLKRVSARVNEADRHCIAKGCPKPQKADYKPGEPIDKTRAPQSLVRRVHVGPLARS